MLFITCCYETGLFFARNVAIEDAFQNWQNAFNAQCAGEDQLVDLYHDGDQQSRIGCRAIYHHLDDHYNESFRRIEIKEEIKESVINLVFKCRLRRLFLSNNSIFRMYLLGNRL